MTKLDNDKTWTNSGKIILSDPENHTYLIETPTNVICRNRIHLQPPAAPSVPQDEMSSSKVPDVPPASTTEPDLCDTPKKAASPPPLRRSSRVVKKPIRFRED